MSKKSVRKDSDLDEAIEEIMEAYESACCTEAAMSMLSEIYRKYRDSGVTHKQVVGIEREPFTDKAIEDPATMEWLDDLWSYMGSMYDTEYYTLYESGRFTGIVRGIIDAPEYIAEYLLPDGYDEADEESKDLYDRFVTIAGKYGVSLEKSISKHPTFKEMYNRLRKKYH